MLIFIDEKISHISTEEEIDEGDEVEEDRGDGNEEVVIGERVGYFDGIEDEEVLGEEEEEEEKEVELEEGDEGNEEEEEEDEGADEGTDEEEEKEEEGAEEEGKGKGEGEAVGFRIFARFLR